jgi:hypothetical protein
MEFELDRSLEILDRTPSVLRSVLDGLDASWTDATEGPDTWSPYVIVGHLIHGERTDWIPRAQIILAQGSNRKFTPYDRFAQFHESQGKSLHDLLGEFARLRAENLNTVRSWNLTDDPAHSRRRAPRVRCGYAVTITRNVGRSRSRSHRTDRAGDGETIPRCRRSMAGLPARHGPLI